MKIWFFITLVCAMFLGGAVADTEIADPEKWYVNEYAPIWAEQSWTKLDQASSFYDDTIADHSPSGEIEVIKSRDWLDAGVTEWVADGWVGSELAGIQTDQ